MEFPANESETFVRVRVPVGLRNSHLLGVTRYWHHRRIFYLENLGLALILWFFKKSRKIITCYVPIIMWQPWSKESQGHDSLSPIEHVTPIPARTPLPFTQSGKDYVPHCGPDRYSFFLSQLSAISPGWTLEALLSADPWASWHSLSGADDCISEPIPGNGLLVPSVQANLPFFSLFILLPPRKGPC